MANSARRMLAADGAAVPSTFTKAPASVLDFTVDWEAWLTEDDSITAVSAVAPSGLSVVSQIIEGTKATVVLSGGAEGEIYRVTIGVSTARGKQDERTIKVRVEGSAVEVEEAPTTTVAPTTTTVPTTSTTGEPGQPGSYTVTGPASGEVRNVPLGLEGNAVASTFTASLVAPYTTTVVTPTDGEADSTFSPTSVTLTAASPSQAIDYSPASYGAKTITFANDRGLTPVTKAFTSLPQAGKTMYKSEGDPDWENGLNYTPDMGGYLPFGVYNASKPLSYLNKDIRNDELDPDSTAIMALHNDPALGNPHLEFIEVGYVETYPDDAPFSFERNQLFYGLPVNMIRAGQALAALNPSVEPWAPLESDAGPFPVPPLASASTWPTAPVNVYPYPGLPYSDQHVLIVDPDNDMLYELYRAYTADGGVTWDHGGAAAFNLASGVLRRDSYSSADGAGLPMFPLLLRYDEAKRAYDADPVDGYIPHALRFTTNSLCFSGNVVWPARHAGGGNAESNSEYAGAALAWGSRIRLKDAWYQAHKAEFTRGFSRVILNTLWRYGMVMADGGSVFYVNGIPDRRWPYGTFDNFTGKYSTPYAQILPTDFEVLKQEVGCSISGAATGTVGQPTVYTLARVPATDALYYGELYLWEGETLRGGCVISDTYPTNTISVTPTSAGVKTYHLTATGGAGYWILPPAFTLTVT